MQLSIPLDSCEGGSTLVCLVGQNESFSGVEEFPCFFSILSSLHRHCSLGPCFFLPPHHCLIRRRADKPGAGLISILFSSVCVETGWEFFGEGEDYWDVGHAVSLCRIGEEADARGACLVIAEGWRIRRDRERAQLAEKATGRYGDEEKQKKVDRSGNVR